METAPVKKNFFTFFGSEWMLGFLVAVLSALIALAAYQSTQAASIQSDLNVAGQKMLTDSNATYLESNQFVIYDYTLYDGWYVNEGVNDDMAQYYQENFSEELTASMDREGGPFDDEYYTVMYAEAEAQYDEAMTSFDDARVYGEKADRLQLVVLIFAVGLALAAYGSILGKESRLRFFFALLSIFGLIYGAVVYLSA